MDSRTVFRPRRPDYVKNIFSCECKSPIMEEKSHSRDESFYPSRFSSDSSQKGKIHLHREFSFKFFKGIC